MAFHEYPYTDFHEMNLDWVIAKVKELTLAWAQTSSDWEELRTFVNDYFANLDVQEEINNKMDELVSDGTLSSLIAPYVASGLPAEVANQIAGVVADQIGAVVAAQLPAQVAEKIPAAVAGEAANWLSEHVDPSTGYVVDDTLTIQGAAADAKATGDVFGDLKNALEYYTAINKKNLLNPDTFIRNYVVVGGSIQPSDNYGYIEIDVTNGTKYVSNTGIRRISGQDKESIITDITEWTATYTGKAYFNYELSRVLPSSVLYVDGADVDTIGSYGSRALADDVMKQTPGTSKIATMSQAAIMNVVSNRPTITYTDGYYMSATRGIIYADVSYKVSNVIYLVKGQRIAFSANGYGANVVSVLGETDESGEFLLESIVTSTGHVYQDIDYTADHNMFVRISIGINTVDPDVVILSNTVNLNQYVIKNIIEVGTSKEYSSLVDAINGIKDSSPTNQYEIHLYEGTYNTVEAEKINDSYYGLMIPDYVSIIGIGNRDNIIISGECPDGYESYAHLISTINFCDNGVLENVTVEAKNLRYCNHDDHMMANTLTVKHSYKNCVFRMKTIDTGFDVSGTCVGIGAMYDKTIYFERCDFINENNDNGNRCCVLLHDSSGINGCYMVLDSCKFSGSRWNIKLSNNDGLLINTVTLKGNKFSQPMLVTTLSGIFNNIFNIRAWGNKAFSYVASGNLTDISSDVDAYANET